MSKLEMPLSRLMWRYERAKSYCHDDKGKEQIDSDLKTIIGSYKNYQNMALELFFCSVSGDFNNPDFDFMNLDSIILWGNFRKWKQHYLSDFEALTAAIEEGCPFQYFEKLI